MSAHDATPQGSWNEPLIDVDVHANIQSIDQIKPFLDPWWIEFIEETGFQAPPWQYSIYPPGVDTTLGSNWSKSGEADSSPVASSPDQLIKDVVDPTRADAVIVNSTWGVDTIRHPDFALGLCRAVNDWLANEWLERDSRLRASIVVPGFVPSEAAEEIDRVGGHPGFVQVLLPARSSRPYGNRIWHPMFEAIERNGLVAGIHYGGFADAPGPNGSESWFLEEYVAAQIGAFQAQLVSMIAEGLFHRFPELRVSLLECGFSWLFPVIWRMDREWQALRRDVPWLTEPPSGIIRRSVKVSSQPVDAGPKDQFARAIDWIGTDEMLMYSSDYPHGFAHDASAVLDFLGDESRKKFMFGNAKDHYRI